jgi:hypothetical protein
MSIGLPAINTELIELRAARIDSVHQGISSGAHLTAQRPAIQHNDRSSAAAFQQ